MGVDTSALCVQLARFEGDEKSDSLARTRIGVLLFDDVDEGVDDWCPEATPRVTLVPRVLTSFLGVY